MAKCDRWCPARRYCHCARSAMATAAAPPPCTTRPPPPLLAMHLRCAGHTHYARALVARAGQAQNSKGGADSGAALASGRLDLIRSNPSTLGINNINIINIINNVDIIGINNIINIMNLFTNHIMCANFKRIDQVV